MITFFIWLVLFKQNNELLKQKHKVDNEQFELYVGVPTLTSDFEIKASRVEQMEQTAVLDVEQVEQEIVQEAVEIEWNQGWLNHKGNIRVEPNKECEILEVLSFNHEITYAYYNNEWCMVKYRDTIAYIHSSLVNTDKATVPSGNPEDMIGTGTYLIQATAYNDKESATGVKLKANHSLAGAICFLGKTCDLYTKDGEYIGTYKFEDTGYGRDLGYGDTYFQKSHKGQGVGSIESGLSVDIWMNSEAECNEWGRREVYITIYE